MKFIQNATKLEKALFITTSVLFTFIVILFVKFKKAIKKNSPRKY